MKKIGMITTILFLVSLFTAPALLAGGAYKSDAAYEHGKQAMKQAGNQGTLMLTDHLIGTDVQNKSGEKVGEIEKVVLDIENGRIGYVTLTGGGVMGIAENEYIVPFNALKAPKSAMRAGEQQGEMRQMFTLTTPVKKLKAVPEGDLETFLSEQRGIEIHQFYGVSPYWEEAGFEAFEPNPEAER